MSQKFEVTHDEWGGIYEVPESMTFGEARSFEKITGTLLKDYGPESGVTAMQGMLWISMKRVHPTIGFSDLDDLDMAKVEDVTEPEEQADGDDALDPTGLPELDDGSEESSSAA